MAYCTVTDLYTVFGEENIIRWADLDNDGVDDYGRVAWAIDVAYDYINSKLLHGRYEIPLNPVPVIIQYLNALYAGILLYDARLISDTDNDQVSRQRKTFNNWIRQIQRGQLKLLLDTTDDVFPIVGEDSNAV